MKKNSIILLIIVILVFICGCSNNKKNNTYVNGCVYAGKCGGVAFISEGKHHIADLTDTLRDFVIYQFVNPSNGDVIERKVPKRADFKTILAKMIIKKSIFCTYRQYGIIEYRRLYFTNCNTMNESIEMCEKIDINKL